MRGPGGSWGALLGAPPTLMQQQLNSCRPPVVTSADLLGGGCLCPISLDLERGAQTSWDDGAGQAESREPGSNRWLAVWLLGEAT